LGPAGATRFVFSFSIGTFRLWATRSTDHPTLTWTIPATLESLFMLIS
jgi:hypothetical protein